MYIFRDPNVKMKYFYFPSWDSLFYPPTGTAKISLAIKWDPFCLFPRKNADNKSSKQTNTQMHGQMDKHHPALRCNLVNNKNISFYKSFTDIW